MAAYHVYPDWQAALHALDGQYCQCEPEIQMVEESEKANIVMVVVHSVLGKAEK